MRTITPLTDWLFAKQDIGLENLKEATWTKVTVPHTWNNLDGQDGGDDYYRGACWYIRKLEDLPADGLLFLEFNGAQSVCDVYVNGTQVGHHEGGFSTFRADITDAVRSREGAASLAVRVDNSENSAIYPQSAGFTCFGGLYRKVSLISVPETHFNLEYYGANGLYVEARPEDDDAVLTVHAYIKNPREGQVLHVSVAGDNAPDFETITLSAASTQVSLYGRIADAHRWDGTDDPYLYKITAVLSDENGEADRVEEYFGVREFAIDPEQGLLLNGRPYPLRGAGRHQDRQNLGWATGETEQEEDTALLMEMGANAVRLPYQNDPYFYELCDRKGLTVWAEIPFTGAMLADGQDNETRQLMELVLQNYNRPSILCWGLASDVPQGGEADEELVRRLSELKALAESLDARPTALTLAPLTAPESPAARITDLRLAGDAFQDRFRELFPSLAAAETDIGPEADLRWHSETPAPDDLTEETQCLFHEDALAKAGARPYLIGTFVSDLFDWADDANETPGANGRSRRGLITFDRLTKKDAFYCYKACWSKEPFVHLCGQRFRWRANKTVTVKAYSNAPEVELVVNGKSFGTQGGSGVFTFENIPLRFLLPNNIIAKAGDATDEMRLNRWLTPCRKYTCPKPGEEKAAGETAEIAEQPEM